MLLTIQAFHHGQWHDAAELVIEHPAQGRRGPARLGYITDYALNGWIAMMSMLAACFCRLS